MECPACGRELAEMKVGDITVDVCKGGCGGIWFDRFELQKVDDADESAGEGLLDIERDESVVVDPDATRMCPRCDETAMMKHFFSIKQEVEVDECPRCAGFWLDYGELAKIRAQFGSAEERDSATRAFVYRAVDAKLAEMARAGLQPRASTGLIAKLFRFLSPR